MLRRNISRAISRVAHRRSPLGGAGGLGPSIPFWNVWPAGAETPGFGEVAEGAAGELDGDVTGACELGWFVGVDLCISFLA
jgi:hypothetical protein